jgi:precorrin-6B methylase 2
MEENLRGGSRISSDQRDVVSRAAGAADFPSRVWRLHGVRSTCCVQDSMAAISQNNTSFRPISVLKKIVVPSGSRPRTIPFGLFKGLRLNIDLTSQTQFYLGLYEFETHPYIKEAFKRSNWLIDAGAGVGELCILFRKNLCRAIAIEPDEACLSLMRSNLALNGLSDSDVEIVPKYVGTASNHHHIRLDDIHVDRSGAGFIKIDIEGSEMDALEGAVSLLGEANVSLLVEVHTRELELRCIEFFEQHRYSSMVVTNSRWRCVIPELRPSTHNRWIWAKPLTFRAG